LVEGQVFFSVEFPPVEILLDDLGFDLFVRKGGQPIDRNHVPGPLDADPLSSLLRLKMLKDVARVFLRIVVPVRVLHVDDQGFVRRSAEYFGDRSLSCRNLEAGFGRVEPVGGASFQRNGGGVQRGCFRRAALSDQRGHLLIQGGLFWRFDLLFDGLSALVPEVGLHDRCGQRGVKENGGDEDGGGPHPDPMTLDQPPTDPIHCWPPTERRGNERK